MKKKILLDTYTHTVNTLKPSTLKGQRALEEFAPPPVKNNSVDMRELCQKWQHI